MIGQTDERSRLIVRYFKARPQLVDGFLAVLVFALNASVLRYQTADCECDVPPWAYVAAAGQTLPIAARRVAPFAINVIVAPSEVISAMAAWPALPVPLGTLIALNAAAAYAKRWQAIVALLAAIFTVPVVLLTRAAGTTAIEIMFTWLVIAVAWLLGSLSHYKQVALEDARRQRDAQALLISSEGARAIAEERARIAREMHDLLTHSVSGMVVLAEGGAASTLGEGQGNINAVFEKISARGRRTLEDLRGMLGVLRDDDQHSTRVDFPENDKEATRQPLPGIRDLPELVASSRESGLEVSLGITISTYVNPAVQLAFYRITQESLTNALKHAHGQPVSIVLKEETDGYRLRVTNPMNPASVESQEWPTGGGQGLRGMSERASSVRADFRVDVIDDAWTVEMFAPRKGKAECQRSES